MHHVLMPLLSFFPYYFLYLCANTSSTVTPTNITHCMSIYPYDHTLFYPGAICSTCKLPKPARSKHCPLCKSCIQKQDHHCIWINNCVGRNNYIYFLLLLLSISILLLYGATLGYSLLDKTLQNYFVPRRLTLGSITSKRWSTGKSWKEYFNLLLLAISWEWQIGAVTLLMLFSFPLSTGFLVYHVYLIWAGMTTNESAKWADWRDDVADGYVFRAKMEDLRGDYPRLEADLEPEVKGWLGGEGVWWVVRTRQGVWPTREVEGQQMEDIRWERVHSMGEMENIYDLGFRDSLRDIVVNRDR
jgi:palmitoyltransferase ZDHHC4